MDLIPKPDQVVAAAGNVAHTLLYGGLADLRPMPRTLIDDGELREVYHYRPAQKTRETGDPVLLVTPLAAPRSASTCAATAPWSSTSSRRGARPTSWSTGRSRSRTAAWAWSTGSTRCCPRRSGSSASTPAVGVHLVGWSLGGIFTLLVAADRRPADRLDHRRRVTRST